MTPATGRVAGLGRTRRLFLGGECEVIVLGNYLCLPALSRRSGDVGSLPPLRSTESKPRTPLSNAGRGALARPSQCTGGFRNPRPRETGSFSRPPRVLRFFRLFRPNRLISV